MIKDCWCNLKRADAHDITGIIALVVLVLAMCYLL